MTPQRRRKRDPVAHARRRAGFSYAEVLVATVILALALVPALESLQIGLLGGEVHESLVVQRPHLVGKMEEVLTRPFLELDAEAQLAAGAPTSYSDPASAPSRRLVYLLPYDGDGDGSPDPGLLQVRVEIEASPLRLETLTSL